ncbi:MAG: hypothetical protein KGI50_02980 [Patescibacteria group bacterium]|nr:hypothetical protein [Patescibacteria group bacterium]MDE2438256.1 hypothetical protein [Patescibacteria group bacterium]
MEATNGTKMCARLHPSDALQACFVHIATSEDLRRRIYYHLEVSSGLNSALQYTVCEFVEQETGEVVGTGTLVAIYKDFSGKIILKSEKRQREFPGLPAIIEEVRNSFESVSDKVISFPPKSFVHMHRYFRILNDEMRAGHCPTLPEVMNDMLKKSGCIEMVEET